MNPFKPGNHIDMWAAPALSHEKVTALVHKVEGDALYIEIDEGCENFQGYRLMKVNYRQCRKQGKKKI